MKGIRLGKILLLAMVLSGSYSTFVQNSRLDSQLSYDKQVYASMDGASGTMVASKF